MKPYLIAILAVGIISAGFHGLGLTRVLPWHIVYSDSLAFYQRIAGPGLVYIEKPVEYPVLTGFFIQIAKTIGQNRLGYFVVNSALLIGLIILSTKLLLEMAGEQRWNIWRYWIFAPSMLLFAVYNWDMIAVFFSVAALYALRRNRDYTAAIMIAFGTAAKFYPILFLIPLLLKQSDWKRILRITACAAGTWLAVNGAVMLANFDGWSYFFRLNQLRSSNPDSIWTVLRFVFAPALESVSRLNAWSLALFAGLFSWFMWKFRKADTALLCFGAVLIFLLTNKVFSPQYTLWLLPFFALYAIPGPIAFYTMEAATAGALFMVLPWFLVKHDPALIYWTMPFVIVRHIVLIIIFVQLIQKLKENKTRR